MATARQIRTSSREQQPEHLERKVASSIRRRGNLGIHRPRGVVGEIGPVEVGLGQVDTDGADLSRYAAERFELLIFELQGVDDE
jgi:hypothetical protein